MPTHTHFPHRELQAQAHNEIILSNNCISTVPKNPTTSFIIPLPLFKCFSFEITRHVCFGLNQAPGCKEMGCMHPVHPESCKPQETKQHPEGHKSSKNKAYKGQFLGTFSLLPIGQSTVLDTIKKIHSALP